MRIGQRVRLTTIKAPHGRIMESLRPEFEKREIGEVRMGPDEGDWYNIQFPALPDGHWLSVHVTMLEVLSKHRG